MRTWLGGRRDRLSLVEAILLEELEQGNARDAKAKGGIDEIQHVGPAGPRVGEEELSNGAGVTRQEFAVGASVHAVMGLADGLPGGQALLAWSGGPAEAEEPSDDSNLEATATVEQKMAEQSGGVIVRTLGLAEAEDSLEQGEPFRRAMCFEELGPIQPVRKSSNCIRHGSSSRRRPEVIYSITGEG